MYSYYYTGSHNIYLMIRKERVRRQRSERELIASSILWMTSGVLLICISLYLALVVVVCIWTYCCIAMHSQLKLVKRSKLGNRTVIYSDYSVLLPEKCNFICPSRVFETIPLVYFFSIFKPSIQSMSIQLQFLWCERPARFSMGKLAGFFRQ